MRIILPLTFGLFGLFCYILGCTLTPVQRAEEKALCDDAFQLLDVPQGVEAWACGVIGTPEAQANAAKVREEVAKLPETAPAQIKAKPVLYANGRPAGLHIDRRAIMGAPFPLGSVSGFASGVADAGAADAFRDAAR